MSIHIFAAFVTPFGTASNNRGENEGNTTTLQKLIWEQQVHTTVSAESIRFALRRRLTEAGEVCNRTYDDNDRANKWQDPTFERWGNKAKEQVFIDDDLLGFMAAEGAKEEGSKGSAKVRRAVLEVTRAVSLTPWPGDTTFNAASPGATPSAQKKGASNPVPYQAEIHATRYQYGIALTPERLREPSRAAVALRHLCALGEVAGNHGRFLYDFSPESAIFRITQEAAPRVLYGFRPLDERRVHIPDILAKVKAGDIKASELVIGGMVVESLSEQDRKSLEGALLLPGVVAACEEACKRLPSGGTKK
jgi:CRISPR-associated protein Cst2